jgi:hypothetical protein
MFGMGSAGGSVDIASRTGARVYSFGRAKRAQGFFITLHAGRLHDGWAIEIES